jgi:tetratricopeptide (TPR) repeat protein
MTYDHDEAHDAFYEGMAFRDRQDYEKALTHFRHSLELHEHYKTCQRIAEMLIALDRATEADEYIERAYHLKPTHSQAATNYAAVLIKRGENEKARDVLIEVVSHNSTILRSDC